MLMINNNFLFQVIYETRDCVDSPLYIIAFVSHSFNFFILFSIFFPVALTREGERAGSGRG